MNIDYTKHAVIQVETSNCLWKFFETKKTTTESNVFIKTLNGYHKDTRLPVTSFSIGDYVEIKTGPRKRNIGLVKQIVFDTQALRRTCPAPTDITLTVDWLYSLTERRRLTGVLVFEFEDFVRKDSYYFSNHRQMSIPLGAAECKINDKTVHIAGEIHFSNEEEH